MINQGTVCWGWQRGFPARDRKRKSIRGRERKRQKESEKFSFAHCISSHTLSPQAAAPTPFFSLFLCLFSPSLSPPHICFLGWCSCCYLLSRTHLIPSRGKPGVLECPGTRCSSVLCFSHQGFMISMPKKEEEGIISVHTKQWLLLKKRLYVTIKHSFIIGKWSFRDCLLWTLSKK